MNTSSASNLYTKARCKLCYYCNVLKKTMQEVYVVATIEFGLMLRQNDSNYTLKELMSFNRSCIEALSDEFTTLWLEDHLQSSATDVLECLTTLAYLAAQYPRLKVGPLVLSQSYRNPALLAKMMANLQA